MGAGPSRLPKKEGFLVDQTEPATGFLLGDIASTSDGPVVLRFPCGMTLDTGSTIKPEPAAVCEVVDVDENPLFKMRARPEQKAAIEREKSEREALEALEGRVGALVDKVGAREADFEKAVRDARAAAGELEAFERDAGTYKLAAGGAAVLLLATTFLATQ